MNVNDFEMPEKLPESLLKDIFEHQHELALKYTPIEVSNGLRLCTDMPVNLHDSKGQALIKDMSWRFVEELGEAMDALENREEVHFYEEIADAMHFMIEKYILCGLSYDSIVGHDLTLLFGGDRPGIPFDKVNPYWLKADFSELITATAMSCNCLKNKPWKQSQMMTDIELFRSKLRTEFLRFIRFCVQAGFTAETLWGMYHRKFQVNQFRQRSGY
jgi:hypothetical protein